KQCIKETAVRHLGVWYRGGFEWRLRSGPDQLRATRGNRSRRLGRLSVQGAPSSVVEGGLREMVAFAARPADRRNRGVSDFPSLLLLQRAITVSPRRCISK